MLERSYVHADRQRLRVNPVLDPHDGDSRESDTAPLRLYFNRLFHIKKDYLSQSAFHNEIDCPFPFEIPTATKLWVLHADSAILLRCHASAPPWLL